MKPKVINVDDWNKMQKKYKHLNLKTWEYLDSIQKLAIMKTSGVPINPKLIFGHNYQIKYPNDIFNYDHTKKYTLSNSIIQQIKDLVKQKHEIGGILIYDSTKQNSDNINMHVLFNGNSDRINLNILDVLNRLDKPYTESKMSLFHTHPDTDNVMYDPPSILDVVNFLILSVKMIVDNNLAGKTNSRSSSLHNRLKIRIGSSLVFTKNEVYVYYISQPLVDNIIQYVNKDIKNIFEEIELYYSAVLYPFNRELKNKEVDQYIHFLSHLGIVMKRYTYNQNIEIYVY
jgi:hypothetical protein